MTTNKAKRLEKMAGEDTANKDANPLKYLAMIAVNEAAPGFGVTRGKKERRCSPHSKPQTPAPLTFPGEPLKVIKKDSQFVKWNFMA